MGKSAKFYKRPSKKEKEVLAVKKIVGEPVIGKKGGKDKKISVPASLFQSTKEKSTVESADQDIDMTAAETQSPEVPDKKKDKKKEAELPDYVDLFSGKKTYKKIPKKRK